MEKKTYLIPGIFLLVLILLESAARADIWEVKQEEAFLPGAEQICLIPTPGTVCLRANAFSQGESIAESAVLENDVLTILLSRPLEAGETVRVLMEGSDAAGDAISYDNSWEISRYGALKEEAAHWETQWDSLISTGGNDALEAFGKAIFRGCVTIAPIAQYSPDEQTVSLDDASDHWQVSVHDVSGDIYGYPFEREDLKYHFKNYGEEIRPDHADKLIVTSSFPFGEQRVTVEYNYLSSEPVRLKSVHVFLKSVDFQPGFTFQADLQDPDAACVVELLRSGTVSGFEWTETMNGEYRW